MSNALRYCSLHAPNGFLVWPLCIVDTLEERGKDHGNRALWSFSGANINNALFVVTDYKQSIRFSLRSLDTPCLDYDSLLPPRIKLRAHFLLIASGLSDSPCFSIDTSGNRRMPWILLAFFPTDTGYHTALHRDALTIAEKVECHDNVDIFLCGIVALQFDVCHWHDVTIGKHCFTGGTDKMLDVHYYPSLPSFAVLCQLVHYLLQ